jgi:hypothetical protein
MERIHKRAVSFRSPEEKTPELKRLRRSRKLLRHAFDKLHQIDVAHTKEVERFKQDIEEKRNRFLDPGAPASADMDELGSKRKAQADLLDIWIPRIPPRKRVRSATWVSYTVIRLMSKFWLTRQDPKRPCVREDDLPLPIRTPPRITATLPTRIPYRPKLPDWDSPF